MKWQYLTIELPKDMDIGSYETHASQINQVLATHGANGWELVSIFAISEFEGETEKLFASFKKPLG